MDYEEDISRELIKCVVVGDTAVGKTRLICAKTCGQRLSLEQLMTVHVPTVWAIDQYRICRNVLEKSFEMIDGVNITLRLWDTFGEHNNDRCYAYGRSDVIVLCFSVANPKSLEHAKNVWFPEIKRMCPNVPVLLVACKVDLRYLCLQSDFQQLLARRRPSPLKPIRPDHIVLPEEGRTAAREMGAFYYETSVFSHFGVEDVFGNAIRAALCRRRHGRLWLGSSLNSIKYPQIQAPYQTPRPEHPPIRILQSHFVNDIGLAFPDDTVSTAYTNTDNFFADCILVAKDRSFRCHRLLLSSGSKFFYQLFVCSTPHCVECSSVIDDLAEVFDSKEESIDMLTPNIGLLKPSHNEQNSRTMREIEQDIWLAHTRRRSCSHSTRSSVCSGSAKPQYHQHPQQNTNHNTNIQHNTLNSKRSLEHTCSHHSDNVQLCCYKSRLPSFSESIHSSSVRRPSLCRKLPHASSLFYCHQHERNLENISHSNLPQCIKSITFDLDTTALPHSTTTASSPPVCRITFDDEKIKADSLLACLQFIYTGDVPLNVFHNEGKAEYEDIIKVAEIFEMKHLIAYLTIRRFGCGFSEFSSDNAKREFLHERNDCIAELGFEFSLFTDVEFVTFNYKMPAHKFLLACRSEVMKAMFSNKFRESCTSQVELAGVYPEVMFVLLNYLYNDTINISFHLNVCEYVETLELANRMCLCRLTNLLEKDLVDFFEESGLDDGKLLEEVLQVLEPCQMCNARQLSSWCLNYLSCHYKTLIEHHGKLLKNLSASNQEYMSAHRWPPIWCLKENEMYERALTDGGQRAAELSASKLLKKHHGTSGCLCFSARTSRRYQHNSI